MKHCWDCHKLVREQRKKCKCGGAKFYTKEYKSRNSDIDERKEKALKLYTDKVRFIRFKKDKTIAVGEDDQGEDE